VGLRLLHQTETLRLWHLRIPGALLHVVPSLTQGWIKVVAARSSSYKQQLPDFPTFSTFSRGGSSPEMLLCIAVHGSLMFTLQPSEMLLIVFGYLYSAIYMDPS
jgi:hypothetical protein